MASPRNRRPGFSRRAQYSLFIGYVIATLGVIGAGAVLVGRARVYAIDSRTGVAAEDLDQPGAHEVVVVDDEHSDHPGSLSSSGRMAASTNMSS